MLPRLDPTQAMAARPDGEATTAGAPESGGAAGFDALLLLLLGIGTPTVRPEAGAARGSRDAGPDATGDETDGTPAGALAAAGPAPAWAERVAVIPSAPTGPPPAAVLAPPPLPPASPDAPISATVPGSPSGAAVAMNARAGSSIAMSAQLTGAAGAGPTASADAAVTPAPVAPRPVGVSPRARVASRPDGAPSLAVLAPVPADVVAPREGPADRRSSVVVAPVARSAAEPDDVLDVLAASQGARALAVEEPEIATAAPAKLVARTGAAAGDRRPAAGDAPVMEIVGRTTHGGPSSQPAGAGISSDARAQDASVADPEPRAEASHASRASSGDGPVAPRGREAAGDEALSLSRAPAIAEVLETEEEMPGARDRRVVAPVDGGRAAPVPVPGAPPAPPASEAPAPSPAPVVEQVVRAARLVLGGGERRLEIHLDPPELGAIRLTVGLAAGTLGLTLEAERPDTRLLLVEAAPRIQAMLAARGLGGTVVLVPVGTPAASIADSFRRSAPRGGRSAPEPLADPRRKKSAERRVATVDLIV